MVRVAALRLRDRPRQAGGGDLPRDRGPLPRAAGLQADGGMAGRDLPEDRGTAGGLMLPGRLWPRPQGVVTWFKLPFPRKREPRAAEYHRQPWTLFFARVTMEGTSNKARA